MVASDGNSYERAEIERVIREGNSLSPLTREPLQQAVFSNRNLKKRIEDYEEEVLKQAEHAFKCGEEQAKERLKRGEEEGRASSSQAPPPKRARR